MVGGVGKALAQPLEKLLRRFGSGCRPEVGEKARAELADLGLGAADRNPVALGQEATSAAPTAILARVRS